VGERGKASELERERERESERERDLGNEAFKLSAQSFDILQAI